MAEALSVMRFWLEIGVDGLRLDAVPYLVEREGTNNENLPETHAILKRIRAEVDAHYPGRMLLAEANQWPEDVQAYFGDGDECHMLFHFPLMPRMYMAIAQEDRFPIMDIMRQTPDAPANCQWATFLRNHDELTLEMVTDKERDYLWKTYAADKRARLNLGIRRRLAPLLEHDRRRIELMNSLLLTIMGTPILYYGDELGMGDNIHLGDRDGVRTPMQWTPDRNGGFSRADPASLVLPAIMDPLYGFQAVNVEAQWRSPYSLLNWVRRMLVVRGRWKAFGRGTVRFLRPQNRKVLVYLREFEGETVLCVANVSRTAQAVELDLSEFAGRTPVELSGEVAFPKIGQLTYLLTLQPFGFYWFSLSAETNQPAWSTATSDNIAEYHTFIIRTGLNDIIDGRQRAILEKEVLPAYVAQRRWYQGKSSGVPAVRIADTQSFDKELLFGVLDVNGEHYALPLAIAWEDAPSNPFEAALALGRVRRGGAHRPPDRRLRHGRICARPAARAGRRVRTGCARLQPRAGLCRDRAGCGDRMAGRRAEQLDADRRPPRRDQAVPPPGRRRPSRSRDGARADGARLHRHRVPHGGGTLQRSRGRRGTALRREPGRRLPMVAGPGRPPDRRQGGDRRRERETTSRLIATSSRSQAAGWARCTSCLRSPRTTPDFAPEEATAGTIAAWRERLHAQLDAAFALRDLGDRNAICAAAGKALGEGKGLPLTRIHGDLHLGQILVAAGDAIIIDFEGRAGQAAGRAARQELAAARCRRHAALIRLCRRRGRAQRSAGEHQPERRPCQDAAHGIRPHRA